MVGDRRTPPRAERIRGEEEGLRTLVGTIAVVGFPNVGKSTLVNRLTATRETVVHARARRHARPQGADRRVGRRGLRDHGHRRRRRGRRRQHAARDRRPGARRDRRGRPRAVPRRRARRHRPGRRGARRHPAPLAQAGDPDREQARRPAGATPRRSSSTASGSASRCRSRRCTAWARATCSTRSSRRCAVSRAPSASSASATRSASRSSAARTSASRRS